MPEKKIIAVIGATGAQGGGLARAILADPDGGFALRALTRKTTGDAAQALARAGAEVVAADLDDVESLKKAFAGAYGLFALTNFWEHFNPQKEFEQATNIAEAAKAAGVKHVIWSTFEDVRDSIPLTDDRMPTLHGKYKVAHFDAKADANHEFTKRGVPTTFLYTSFYWENYIHFGSGPVKQEDGTYAITFPMGDKLLPGIGVEDIGKFAYGIFKAGDEFIGKTVGVAGEHITGAQMAADLSQHLGVTVKYNDVDPDLYRSFGFPGADDLGNMFQFKRDFNALYTKNRDMGLVKRLNPEVRSHSQWLAHHAKNIPLG
jgi:uncharacterized protein YbjT (DUF2867 family)